MHDVILNQREEYKMIKKNMICKISVLVDINHDVSSSTNFDYADMPISSIIEAFSQMITDMMIDLGFQPTDASHRSLSLRNSGYAVYDSFAMKEEMIGVKFLIDIRSGDHPSKPDLDSKTKTRLDGLIHEFPSYDKSEVSVIDSYLAKHSSNIALYIGKGSSYSQPVDSLDKGVTILRHQVIKFIKKAFVEGSESLLRKYDEDLIELAHNYLDDMRGISEYTLNDKGEFEENDSSISELEAREYYITLGIESNIILDVSDFDNVCALIQLKEKYD